MIRTPTSIALVEDDPSLRKILAETLAGSPGWELAGIFADSEAALLAIPAKPPKVVLMDIQLPGLSGIECVARLKKTTAEEIAALPGISLKTATTLMEFLRRDD